MPGPPEGLTESTKRSIEDSKLGRDKIASALAKAQGEYGVAERDTEGNYGDRGPDGKKKRFASLPSVWEACVPALSKNEIAVICYTYWTIMSVKYDDGMQKKVKKGEEVDLTTDGKGYMQGFVVVELVHMSGQRMSSEMPLLPERQTNKYDKRVRNESQDLAAAKSYWKRQLFQDLAFANIAEDDYDSIDRNSNRGEPEESTQAQQTNKEERAQRDKEKAFEQKKADFIASCNAYHAKYVEANKEELFIKIVNDAGYTSLKGITDEDDMDTIMARLMEAAKQLPEPKEKENDNGKPE